MISQKVASPHTKLFSAIIFLLIFIMAARTPLDSDMWWHLRSGEVSIEAGKPLTVDLFSHTQFGEQWINHSWLAQVLMTFLFKWSGSIGLTTWVALMAAGSLLIVFFQLKGPPLLRAFLLLIPALVSAPVWSPRPQLFSLVFLAILSIFLSQRVFQQKYYWFVIPVLFVLWSNFHGGYVLGVILIVCFILGEIINLIFRYPWRDFASQNKQTWGDIRRYLGCLLLVIGAVIVNPNGFNMWMVPFQTVGVDALRDFIPEWASPNFHQIIEQPFLWLFFLTFISIIYAKRGINGVELVILVVFSYLGFLSKRNFGPFAILATPILGKYTWYILQDIQQKRNDFRDSILNNIKIHRLPHKPIPIWLNILLNSFILLILSLAGIGKVLYVSSAEIKQPALNAYYPTEAINWIQINQPPQPMFNNYNWGGYLIWFLRDYPVFIDGRTDLYSGRILQDYITIMTVSDGWEVSLNNYDIRLVFVSCDSRLSTSLTYAEEWGLVFADDTACLYKKISGN
jgi:hypothetical protein